MKAVPALHVITDDAVLTRPRFRRDAQGLLEAHGLALALHLRGPATPVRTLFELAEDLVAAARGTEAWVLVNDRVDVALAAGVTGVQLAGRSLAAAAVRRMAPDRVIGVSTHQPAEVERAEADGADFALVGTIWETRSHPGRPGAGLDRVRSAGRRSGLPLVAIGGVSPERAAGAREAGAAGVAVLSGIWGTDDPVAAAGEYLEAMRGKDGTHDG